MTNFFKAGQAVQCNRCRAKFNAPAGFETGPFMGQYAARQTKMTTCPICGTTDGHWVLLDDVVETKDALTGTPYQQKEQLKAWSRMH